MDSDDGGSYDYGSEQYADSDEQMASSDDDDFAFDGGMDVAVSSKVRYELHECPCCVLCSGSLLCAHSCVS